MSNYQLASLGCKILGIYALLTSIQLFGNIFQMFAFASDNPAFGASVVLSTVVPFALMVTSGVALIFFSDKFAAKMTNSETGSDQTQIVSAKDVQSIAFSIVGLVLLVLSFPKMVQIGWNLYIVKRLGDERHVAEILKTTWRFALATGVQFVIGFILFIGSEIFSTLWHKSVKRLRYEKNIS